MNRTVAFINALGIKAGGLKMPVDVTGEDRTRLGEGRISLPEALVAAKIGQAGIHAHARAGGHNQQIGLGNKIGGVFKIGRIHAVIITMRSKHDKYLNPLL
jgi:hypothetical protein